MYIEFSLDPPHSFGQFSYLQYNSLLLGSTTTSTLSDHHQLIGWKAWDERAALAKLRQSSARFSNTASHISWSLYRTAGRNSGKGGVDNTPLMVDFMQNRVLLLS
jgi:hypothetical protein